MCLDTNLKVFCANINRKCPGCRGEKALQETGSGTRRISVLDTGRNFLT